MKMPLSPTMSKQSIYIEYTILISGIVDLDLVFHSGYYLAESHGNWLSMIERPES